MHPYPPKSKVPLPTSAVLTTITPVNFPRLYQALHLVEKDSGLIPSHVLARDSYALNVTVTQAHAINDTLSNMSLGQLEDFCTGSEEEQGIVIRSIPGAGFAHLIITRHFCGEPK